MYFSYVSQIRQKLSSHISHPIKITEKDSTATKHYEKLLLLLQLLPSYRVPKAQCPSRNISLHFKHFFLPETPLSVCCDEDNSIIGAPEVFGRNSSGCLMWSGYRHSPGLAGSISSRPSFHLRAFLEKCKRFLSKLQNVFVQIAKYVCSNWSMYLFKLQKNVTLQVCQVDIE